MLVVLPYKELTGILIHANPEVFRKVCHEIYITNFKLIWPNRLGIFDFTVAEKLRRFFIPSNSFYNSI